MHAIERDFSDTDSATVSVAVDLSRLIRLNPRSKNDELRNDRRDNVWTKRWKHDWISTAWERRQVVIVQSPDIPVVWRLMRARHCELNNNVLLLSYPGLSRRFISDSTRFYYISQEGATRGTQFGKCIGSIPSKAEFSGRFFLTPLSASPSPLATFPTVVLYVFTHFSPPFLVHSRLTFFPWELITIILPLRPALAMDSSISGRSMGTTKTE